MFMPFCAHFLQTAHCCIAQAANVHRKLISLISGHGYGNAHSGVFATPGLHCHSVHGCCVPAPCVPSICRDSACSHGMPELLILRPWERRAFTAASPLSVPCVCVRGPAALQCPQGGLLVLPTPQMPLEQTKLMQGVAFTCLPGLGLCSAPVPVSDQHTSGWPLLQAAPLFMVTAVTDSSDFICNWHHPGQRVATPSGKVFQCLLSIKAWRSWKHWLYPANPSV